MTKPTLSLAAAAIASLLLVSPAWAEPPLVQERVAPAPQAQLSARRHAPARFTESERTPWYKGKNKRPAMLVGGATADGSLMVGFGLFRVPKVNHNDPNRANPMRDPTGRTSRTAALGLSLAF